MMIKDELLDPATVCFTRFPAVVTGLYLIVNPIQELWLPQVLIQIIICHVKQQTHFSYSSGSHPEPLGVATPFDIYYINLTKLKSCTVFIQ